MDSSITRQFIWPHVTYFEIDGDDSRNFADVIHSAEMRMNLELFHFKYAYLYNMVLYDFLS